MEPNTSNNDSSRVAGFVVLVILAIAVVLAVAWYYLHGRGATPPIVAHPVPKTAVAAPAPPATAGEVATPAVAPLPPLPPVPKTIKIGGPSDEELYGGDLAPGETGVAGRGGVYARETGTFDQEELHDAAGAVVREGARVHVVACPGGRQVYVYQYTDRADFGTSAGTAGARTGHDYPRYEQAVRAACAR